MAYAGRLSVRVQRALEAEMMRTLTCRYCGCCPEAAAGKALTFDHVVPAWVPRAFPQFWRLFPGLYQTADRNKVPACDSCNRKKGAMPVVEFLELRHSKTLWHPRHAHWGRVAARAALRDPAVLAMREEIFEAFSKPMPVERRAPAR